MAPARPPSPFSPAFRAALQQAIATPTVLAIPAGMSHAFVTAWEGPGTPIQAVYAQKINATWSVQAEASWHGGPPKIGFQLHGAW